MSRSDSTSARHGLLPATAAAMPSFTLLPGDFHFCQAPALLVTLLGSCVTITLWHPRRHLGGMCHILLPGYDPQLPPQSVAGRPLATGRYAEAAFALFDAAMARYGTQPTEYLAGLYGGGNMFPAMKSFNPLGQRNIVAARDFLQRRRIPVVDEHTGGTGRRKLSFDLETGAVELHYVESENR